MKHHGQAGYVRARNVVADQEGPHGSDDDRSSPDALSERISMRARISSAVRLLVGCAIPLVLAMRFVERPSLAFAVVKTAVLLIGVGVAVSTMVLAANQRKIDELVRARRIASGSRTIQTLEAGDGTGASVRLYRLGAAASLLAVVTLACGGCSLIADFVLIVAALALAVLGILGALTWRRFGRSGHAASQEAEMQEPDGSAGRRQR